jgi:hypothetical protein
VDEDVVEASDFAVESGYREARLPHLHLLVPQETLHVRVEKNLLVRSSREGNKQTKSQSRMKTKTQYTKHKYKHNLTNRSA